MFENRRVTEVSLLAGFLSHFVGQRCLCSLPMVKLKLYSNDSMLSEHYESTPHLTFLSVAGRERERKKKYVHHLYYRRTKGKTNTSGGGMMKRLNVF